MRERIHQLLLHAVALSCSLLTIEVSAEPHPIALSWQAPSSCVDGGAVRAEVDRLLGGRPSGAKRMVVDAQVRGAARQWSLQMVIRDDAGEGERNVDATSCDELADAAALIIALAFDPDAVAETRRREKATPQPPPPAPVLPVPIPEPAPTPSPPPPPTAPPDLPAPPTPTPPPPASQRVWFSIAPRIDFDAGTLPAVSLGVGGSLALRWYPIVARVRGSYFLPQSETLEGSDKGGDLDLWMVAAGMCATPYHSAAYGRRRALDLALDVCAELEAGEMRGEGFGVKNPGSGATAWLSPHAQVWAALSLAEPLTARGMIGLGVPLLRPDFVLRQVGVVHAANPVVGRLGLEIAAVF